MYDRSSSSNSIDAALRGSSELKVGLLVKTDLQPFNFTGSSGFNVTPVMLQIMSMNLSGSSSMSIDDKFLLRHRLGTALSGSGDMVTNIGVRTPVGDIQMTGKGELVDANTFVTQAVEENIVGRGDMNSELILQVFLEASLSGESDMQINDKFKLLTPMSSDLGGSGDIELRRVGALNSDTIEFTGLGLKPGQTLIIDTDELNVFIDNVLDVSKVTSDSVFFQLQPGENEITFTSNNNPNLQVTMIWQNRWL